MSKRAKLMVSRALEIVEKEENYSEARKNFDDEGRCSDKVTISPSQQVLMEISCNEDVVIGNSASNCNSLVKIPCLEETGLSELLIINYGDDVPETGMNIEIDSSQTNGKKDAIGADFLLLPEGEDRNLDDISNEWNIIAKEGCSKEKILVETYAEFSFDPGDTSDEELSRFAPRKARGSSRGSDFDPTEHGSSGSSTSDSDDHIAEGNEQNQNDEPAEAHAVMSEVEVARNQKLLDERKNWLGRPKKGRKKKYPGQTFATRKKLRDSNQSHYTVGGKVKEKHCFVDFDCNCPMKCRTKVSAEKRESLYKNFWDLGSYDSQTGFIAATITEFPIKRKRSKTDKSKTFTRTYHLDNINVCRNMYIKTYQISTKRVNTALKKIREGVPKDKRGKSGGKKKIADTTVQKVIDHIKKCPTYVSHCARSYVESKFLAYDLTESKMYELYLEDLNPKVSFTMFKHIFYLNFNLRRKPPVKDTCNKCDFFNMQIKNSSDEDSKQKLLDEHNAHIQAASLAREALQEDMKKAKTDANLETLCYDMEKVLGLPKLPTNIVYYKIQLSIYNEGIHTGSTYKPYAFTWKEGVAGRGAQEVGSCLKKFIEVYLKEDVKKLIVWSDSCGGQNRNIKIVLLLKTVLHDHPSLETIYFKYLESGHSFLPNDTDFGEIERAMKHQVRIYTLEEFHYIIKHCKKRNNCFTVHNMQKEDFFSTAEIEKRITNRKMSTSKEKVSWMKTTTIRIEKNKPHSIFLKEYAHSEEKELEEKSTEDEDSYKEVNISKVARGRPKGNETLGRLEQLYPEGKPVSEKKAEDIKSLMKFIPLHARPFYKIGTTLDFEDDLDGYGEVIDFEIEAVE